MPTLVLNEEDFILLSTLLYQLQHIHLGRSYWPSLQCVALGRVE